MLYLLYKQPNKCGYLSRQAYGLPPDNLATVFVFLQQNPAPNAPVEKLADSIPLRTSIESKSATPCSSILAPFKPFFIFCDLSTHHAIPVRVICRALRIDICSGNSQKQILQTLLLPVTLAEKLVPSDWSLRRSVFNDFNAEKTLLSLGVFVSKDLIISYTYCSACLATS